MVRAACILVLLSVAGASAIGMTKVLAPLFSAETAVAAVASDTKSSDAPPRFTRVRPKPGKLTSLEQRVKPAPQLPVEEVVVTVPATPKATFTLKSGSKPPAPKADAFQVVEPRAVVAKAAAPKVAVPAPAADKAPSSRDVPVLGLKPIVPRETVKPAAAVPSARITLNVDAPPPVVINVKPAKSQLEPTEERNVLAESDTLPPTQSLEPVPAARDDAVATPPLPAKAPVNAAPLIRSTRAPIAPERLTSILAEIEEEAEEPVTTSLGRPQQLRSTAERRIHNKRGVTKKARRAHRVARKRHTRRARSVYRAAPARRMVCFGHTCRFQ